MKKIIKLLTVLSLIPMLCGCDIVTKFNNILKRDNEPVIEDNIKEIEELPYPREPEYKDENPIKVGIYKYNGSWDKVSEYTYSSWTRFQPIIQYNVFLTDIDHINGGSTANTFDSYKKNYSTPFKYGVNIAFTNDKEEYVSFNSKGVENVLEYNGYLLIYLYDAVKHRYDSWYSHTTVSEWNDSSNITSIKVCPGDRYEQITSDIEVTVFTYDSDDDFDKDGNYRGNSKHTVTLKKV
ncbi:MAG: hypothetical protein IKP79_02645 [Bacilli bacterium]|nr:hypothetical protein [Bacilli bacterium]